MKLVCDNCGEEWDWDNAEKNCLVSGDPCPECESRNSEGCLEEQDDE